MPKCSDTVFKLRYLSEDEMFHLVFEHSDSFFSLCNNIFMPSPSEVNVEGYLEHKYVDESLGVIGFKMDEHRWPYDIFNNYITVNSLCAKNSHCTGMGTILLDFVKKEYSQYDGFILEPIHSAVGFYKKYGFDELPNGSMYYPFRREFLPENIKNFLRDNVGDDVSDSY